MKRWLSSVVIFASLAAGAAGDLDVARQALNDGVWASALAAADRAATNAADRTAARLIALEALARQENDTEIRKRLSAWKEETNEHFRFWRARAQVRVGDFEQAGKTLKEPFADPALALPVTNLKASMRAATGDKAGALSLIDSVKIDGKAGAAAEDARLIRGELLGETGKMAEACEVLRPLAESAERKEVKLRASYLLGFAEMAQPATHTAGVARVRGLLRSQPGEALSVAAARTFADRLLASGDYAGADDEYRRYLEINPAAAMDADVLDRRGRASLMLGRRPEAAAMFARAEQCATNPAMKASAAFRQAEAFLADGRYPDAAACFARSAGYGGEAAARARFSEADAWERAGEMARAEGLYNELAQVNDVWGEKSKLRKAVLSVRKGQIADAIKIYDGLIKTNQLSEADITETYLGRGRACYRDYRFKEAMADFEQVAKRDPKRADRMRFLSVLCLYGAGKDVDAKASAASLMTATKDQELRADLMLWCAKFEFNRGEYVEARTHFEMYADLCSGTPKAVEALLWAARCSTALTDYSKAVELATKAATASAADSALFVEALLVQGEAVMELGRYAEAVQVFDRAAKQAGDGPNATQAAVLKADALYAMGANDLARYEEAIAAYRNLPDGNVLSPDRKIEVAFKIGRALEKAGQKREAMDQYYKNVVLAYAEATTKDVFFGTPARTFFARAAFALADYLGGAGNTAAAKHVLERVIAADVPAAEEARRRLAALKGKGGVP